MDGGRDSAAARWFSFARQPVGFLAAAALAGWFWGCVALPEASLPQEPPERPAATDGAFPGLDPGAYHLDSLHFKVSTYGAEAARRISEDAEAAYNRIMLDTDLFSFRPKDLYRIVVYATKEEYHQKTGQPAWSGGLSVGNAIYSYQGPNLARTAAHEMTHLVFYEYMGRANLEHRWVNEGLAVYQESKAAGEVRGTDVFSSLRGLLREIPLPMEQLIRLVPSSEREYTVNRWYAQAESMVRYMIERGGRLGFSQFLGRLRDGKGFDEAIAASFPGVWRSLPDFEQGWLRSLP